ncbi:MAG: hypothetical protein MHM6MM_001700 [Cercozoa sp. M6MM]
MSDIEAELAVPRKKHKTFRTAEERRQYKHELKRRLALLDEVLAERDRNAENEPTKAVDSKVAGGIGAAVDVADGADGGSSSNDNEQSRGGSSVDSRDSEAKNRQVVGSVPSIVTCKKVLQNLIRMDARRLFLEPVHTLSEPCVFRPPPPRHLQVDPVKLGIPDYFNVVKFPMDLGTVKKRVAAGQCLTPRRFVNLVRLVFQNAMLYNPASNYVHKVAKGFLSQFEQMIADWPEECKMPEPEAILLENETPQVLNSEITPEPEAMPEPEPEPVVKLESASDVKSELVSESVSEPVKTEQSETTTASSGVSVSPSASHAHVDPAVLEVKIMKAHEAVSDALLGKMWDWLPENLMKMNDEEEDMELDLTVLPQKVLRRARNALKLLERQQSRGEPLLIAPDAELDAM